MTETPRNHSPQEQLSDPAAGETLLPEHAENDAKMARQEATVVHESSVEKQERVKEAEIAARNAARNEINPLERFEVEKKAEAERQAPSARVIDHELQSVGLQQGYKKIRRQETRPQRVLSHVIHQPAVRLVSAAASQSISRPSGLLGGGLVAFLGSLGYLYLTHRDKAHYNYFVFLVLFVVGFVVGLLLELAVYVGTASARRPHD